MVDLSSIAGLHERQHEMRCYCAKCHRWRTLDLRSLISRGRGNQRVPFAMRALRWARRGPNTTPDAATQQYIRLDHAARWLAERKQRQAHHETTAPTRQRQHGKTPCARSGRLLSCRRDCTQPGVRTFDMHEESGRRKQSYVPRLTNDLDSERVRRYR